VPKGSVTCRLALGVSLDLRFLRRDGLDDPIRNARPPLSGALELHSRLDLVPGEVVEAVQQAVVDRVRSRRRSPCLRVLGRQGRRFQHLQGPVPEVSEQTPGVVDRDGEVQVLSAADLRYRNSHDLTERAENRATARAPGGGCADLQ
jgi:hypothetical protein